MPLDHFVLYSAFELGNRLALLECHVARDHAGGRFEIQEYLMQRRDVACGAREVCLLRKRDLDVAFALCSDEFAQDGYCLACPREPGYEWVTHWAGGGGLPAQWASVQQVQGLILEEMEGLISSFGRPSKAEIGVRTKAWTTQRSSHWRHLDVLNEDHAEQT